MNILFIGTYIAEQMRDDFAKISSYLDLPGFVLQNNIHLGLSKQSEVRSIVVPVLCTKFSNSKVEGGEFNWNGFTDNYSIPYINIRGYKELSVPRKILKYLDRVNYVPDVVFVYSIGTISYTVATTIKKEYPSVKIISLITDLPEYMSGTKNIIYRTLKSVDSKIVNHLARKFDGFVLLSPYMREKLPIMDKPWIQVEGIYNPQEEDKLTSNSKEKYIFYGGALEERYGLLDLVEAFKGANLPDYELHLCGYGTGIEKITKAANSCPRIKYLGMIPHKEVLQKQRQATLLINPRKSNEIFTRYSFPSKTMEYLSSGTPTLMSHLPCMPKEYDEHIYYFEEETIDGIRKSMEEVLNKPQLELLEKGAKAREFILKEKNSLVQSKRILDFIDSLH